GSLHRAQPRSTCSSRWRAQAQGLTALSSDRPAGAPCRRVARDGRYQAGAAGLRRASEVASIYERSHTRAARYHGHPRGRHRARPELESAGLNFAEQALVLPSEGAARSLDRDTLLRSLFAEARKEQKATEAQRIAVAELRRHDANTDATTRQFDMVGMNGQWST